MTRPFLIVALLFAVLAAIFSLGNFGGGALAFYLLVGAVICTIIGAMTGH